MVKSKTIYLYTLALIFAVNDVLFAQNNFRIIGYLPTYSWTLLPTFDFGKVTHVNLCFANPDADGNLVFNQNVSDVVIPAHNRNTKVFISIGGGYLDPTTTVNYTNRLSLQYRTDFVKKIVAFVTDNNLDGVDVDIENDALLIPYYNEFVVELAIELHKVGKEISAAVATWSGDRINKAALDSYDWINLMCYDATGPWTPTAPAQHSPMSMVTDDYAYWNATRLVDKHKTVIGVPFYGYEFVDSTTVNTLKYNEIVALYPGSENNDVVNGNLFYNGITTISQKAEFAYLNAGGIMFWEWGQDAIGAKSLLNVIYNKVISFDTGVKPINISYKVYSNQINNRLIIELPLSDVCIVEIYSVFAKKMFSEVFQFNIEIYTDDWEKGVYLVELKIRNSIQVVKVII